MIMTLPTTTGPNGRVLPDWTHAPGGVAPAVWRLAPDQPGGGAVRVVVPDGVGEPTAGVFTAARPAAPAKSSPAKAQARPPAVLPCTHRGEAPTGEVVCGPCGGKVRLKVYPCAVFGSCTVGTRSPGVAGCCDGGRCSGYVADQRAGG